MPAPLRRRLRTALLIFAFSAPLLAVSSGAAAITARVLLATALADGARQTSMTMSGKVVASGLTVGLNGRFTSSGSGGATYESGVGAEDIVEPLATSYCFVRASFLAILKDVLGVKTPTASEIGVWYKLSSSDPRFASIASLGGARTVAQMFSFSPVGWSRSAKYEGTIVIKGVRMIKLGASSNAFVTGSSLAPTTLYVTDTSTPLPFAMSGPVGSTGLIYFSGWGTTKILIPSAKSNLPQ